MIEAVRHLLPERYRDDAADLEDILDAAGAWQRGEIPLNALMQLGTVVDHHGRPSPRYSRWVAVATATRHDPRRLALLDALDIVADASGVITHQGFFTQEEAHQHDRAAEFVRMSRAPWERPA